MLCEYALNKRGELVHVEDVPNGKSCECHCPYCNEPMIAKNGGKIVEHHFAHFSGAECEGYVETVLHLLAKEIIAEEKCIMLPRYHTLPSKLIQFETVEVEERHDNKSIQPDIVGVTKDGLRLQIEIFVTHRVDEIKKEKIVSGGYNCLEIKIPKKFEEKISLKEFLTKQTESRYFINFPYGDLLMAKDNANKHSTIASKLIVDNIEKRDNFEKRVEKQPLVLLNEEELNKFIDSVKRQKVNLGQYASYFGKPCSKWTESDWKEYYGRNKFVK